MQSLCGHIIQALPSMDDPVFKGTVVFIIEHNEKGAAGFVFNKPSGRYLNQLEEFKNCKPVPLYEGGPVDKEHLYFLHLRPDLIEEGKAIKDGIYLGGNFNQAIEALNKGSIETTQLKLFIGYCGWDANELEAEVAEGSWMIPAIFTENIFG
jgi:putative transcriptional regulator